MADKKPTKTKPKTPMIFIHGFRGSPDGLKAIADKFPDYDVHMPYIPPSGNKALAAYDIKHYVAYIRHYIAKNKLKNPILVGHSMGTIIAAAVANRYAQFINKKLIFLSPITKKVARPIAWLTPLIMLVPGNFVSSVTNRFLFVPKYNRYLYEATLEEAAEGAKKYTSKADIMRASWFSSNNSVDIFKLHQKVLIIAGEKDRIMPQVATKKFAKKINAKLKFIPGVGHLLNYEKPEAVAKLMRDFLKR